eukprot:254918_1
MSDSEWDQSVYAQDYIAVVYSYFTLVFMIALCIIFIIELRKSNTVPTEPSQTNSISGSEDIYNIKSITRVSIAAIFVYLLSAITLTIALTKWVVIDQEHGNPSNRLLYQLSYIPYAINIFGLLFYILAQRLNGLVRSKCLNITSYVLPIIAPCAVAIPPIAGLAGDATFVVAALTALIILIIYCVFAIMYLLQITKTMQRIIEMNMESEEKQTMQKEDEVVVTFKSVQDTVRCALLVMICCISNFGLPILAIAALPHTRHPEHRNTLPLFGTLTDTMINASCVFLLFGFAESYYLCACRSCHGCVLKCCVKRVTAGFVKKDSKYSREEYELLLMEKVEKPGA